MLQLQQRPSERLREYVNNNRASFDNMVLPVYRSQGPARKAPAEPIHRRKPPIPPDAKKHSVRGGQSHEHKDDAPEVVDYRTQTPQEVMK